MGGDDYPDIRFAIAKGTLLWQPAKFLGQFADVAMNDLYLVALSFDDGFEDREAAFKRLNGNNPATSYTHLVSIGATIWEFSVLKLAIFGATRPQFDYRFSFGTMAF